jgi:hypothetical protein
VFVAAFIMLFVVMRLLLLVTPPSRERGLEVANAI